MTERVAFRIKENMLAEIKKKVDEGIYEDLSSFFRAASRTELIAIDDDQLGQLAKKVEQQGLDILELKSELRGLVAQFEEKFS